MLDLANINFETEPLVGGLDLNNIDFEPKESKPVRTTIDFESDAPLSLEGMFPAKPEGWMGDATVATG